MDSESLEKVRELIRQRKYTGPGVEELKAAANQVACEAYQEVLPLYEELQRHMEIGGEQAEREVTFLKNFELAIIPKILAVVNCLMTINTMDALMLYQTLGGFILTQQQPLQKLLLYLAYKYENKDEYPDLNMFLDDLSKQLTKSMRTVLQG